MWTAVLQLLFFLYFLKTKILYYLYIALKKGTAKTIHFLELYARICTAIQKKNKNTS